MAVSTGALLGMSAIGAGSNVFTNMMSASSNKKAMRRQYEYNLALQKQAQEWQERMSNTAHQREVDDLITAGLNPILSATGGSGASSGSAGLNSTSAMAPTIQNPVEALSQAMSLMSNTAQIDQIKATTDNLKQNTSKQAVETFHEFEKINQTLADTRLKLKQGDLTDAERDKIYADIDFLEYQKQAILSNVQYQSNMASTAKYDAETRRIETENNPFKFAKSLITNKETPKKINSVLNRFFTNQKGSYR